MYIGAANGFRMQICVWVCVSLPAKETFICLNDQMIINSGHFSQTSFCLETFLASVNLINSNMLQSFLYGAFLLEKV